MVSGKTFKAILSVIYSVSDTECLKVLVLSYVFTYVYVYVYALKCSWLYVLCKCDWACRTGLICTNYTCSKNGTSLGLFYDIHAL